MKASYLNDTQKGPGRGFLSVTETGDLVFPEEIRFGIKRASDRSCLGKGGWQSAEIFLQPLGAFSAGEGLTLAVGPDVVDNLDPRETYRMMLLQADGGSAVCSLQVHEVAYSVLRDGSGTGAVPGWEPEPEEKKTGTPPPEEKKNEAPAPAGPESLPASDAAPEEADRTKTLPLPAPEVRKKPIRLLFAGLLLLVLAGGGIAAWKILSDGQPAPTDLAPAPAENAPGADNPPVADKTTQQEKPPTESRTPLARAREHLAGPADPVQGIRIAKELREEEGGADAAFLLAEDAAGKGNAEAMLLTGIFYDPSDSAPSGSIIKDAEQALSWYRQASRAGLTEAKTRLAALRAWAEAEAAKGSADARDLLERF